MKNALPIALALAAPVLGLAPAAQAAPAAVTVDCTTGPVRLSGTGETYDLVGACSTVTVRGSRLVVHLESARKVVVRASTTTVTVAGDAGRVDVRGSSDTITGRSATSLSYTGSSGRVAFTRLEALRIKGAANKAVVEKGTTTVSVTGASNVVRVNRRR